jgi:beta-mannosidase
MGLMYWQINDIWQAPTWSTIEYGLKWKMAHYYVQHMYEPIYPLAILKPYLANITDENAQISLYVISDVLNETNGQLMCSIHTLNTFSVRLSFVFNVFVDFATVQHVTDFSYATLMKRAGCSNDNHCILHCSFNYNHRDIKQTLFLTQPKNYQLYQPNLYIQNIQQVSPTDVNIVITATRPALFVWLDVPADISGYFSQNGFHMFESMRTISFHSWTPITDFDSINFDLRISSLFDVTQP